MEPFTNIAKHIGIILQHRSLKLTTAESCTGGLIGAALTSVAGSSTWFLGGYIAYSNQAKHDMLGVDLDMIERQGAVSGPVVAALANAALANTEADFSIAVSGIAGPDGGTDVKPVGTVWIAWGIKNQQPIVQEFYFSGDRKQVRYQAVEISLLGLLSYLQRGKIEFDTLLAATGQHKRLFLAIWPAEKIRDEVVKAVTSCLKGEKVKPLKADDVHLTLAFLGDIDAITQASLEYLLAQIELQPFDITMDQINHWKKIKALILEPSNPPKQLLQLVETINTILLQVGITPEERVFRPHLTLARRVIKLGELPPFDKVTWQVHDFCLAESTGGQQATRYNILERWPEAAS